MWLTQINTINKFWKYSNSTYEFTRIINTLMISTDWILYNKKVTTYKIKEY